MSRSPVRASATLPLPRASTDSPPRDSRARREGPALSGPARYARRGPRAVSGAAGGGRASGDRTRREESAGVAFGADAEAYDEAAGPQSRGGFATRSARSVRGDARAVALEGAARGNYDERVLNTSDVIGARLESVSVPRRARDRLGGRVRAGGRTRRRRRRRRRGMGA